MRATWSALGTVGHWGHVHTRKNRYQAVVTLSVVDNVWKITGLNLLDEARIDAYAHVQTLELEYFESRSTGGLMSVLNDDVNQLERFLDHGANAILQVSTTVVAVGATFFILSPLVAAWAVLPIPVILWGSFAYQRRLEPRYEKVRALVGDLNVALANKLGGVSTIKAFSAEAIEQRRFEEASRTAFAGAYRARTRLAIYGILAFSLSALPPMLAAAYLALLAREGTPLFGGVALAFVGFAVCEVFAFFSRL